MRRFHVWVWASGFCVMLLTAGSVFAQTDAPRSQQPKAEPTPTATATPTVNATPAAKATPSASATQTPAAATPTPATVSPTPAPTPPSNDPAVLYEEASKYVERKFEEFRRNRMPFSRALAAETFQQQRELAARYAAALVARGGLAGTDNYYLGLLYELAGKQSDSIAPLGRFLDAPGAKGTKEQLQNARLTLGVDAATAKRFAEAERLLADYRRAEPLTPQGLFKLHHALARAYEADKKIEQSTKHARDAFKAAKESPIKTGDESSRARVVSAAAEFLADVLLKSKQEAEAAATMEELLRIGLAQPSAQIFMGAARWLAANEQEKSIERVLKETPPASALTTTAPEINIDAWIDHKPVKLADLRGRVVLIDFWATWCGPCRVTMPRLKALHERFKKQGLTVIGLTQYFGRAGRTVLTPQEELEHLRAYKKELKLPYAFAVAADEDNDVRYGVQAIPTAFVLDRRGRVRYISVGASEASHDELTDIVERLLDEQP